MRRKSLYQWGKTFFGLPNNYKRLLYEEVSTIAFNSNGTSWYEVYNMPINIRKFCIMKMKHDQDQSKKDAEKNSNTNKSKISKPPKR